MPAACQNISLCFICWHRKTPAYSCKQNLRRIYLMIIISVVVCFFCAMKTFRTTFVRSEHKTHSHRAMPKGLQMRICVCVCAMCVFGFATSTLENVNYALIFVCIQKHFSSRSLYTEHN